VETIVSAFYQKNIYYQRSVRSDIQEEKGRVRTCWTEMAMSAQITTAAKMTSRRSSNMITAIVNILQHNEKGKSREDIPRAEATLIIMTEKVGW